MTWPMTSCLRIVPCTKVSHEMSGSNAAKPGQKKPSHLEPNYIYEREQHKSKLWLPESFNQGYSATYKEIETGWSIKMDETPLSDTLPELPKATAIYTESGRHWFWASYTLVQEHG